MDQMDLLQEQMKMLAGEVALSISSLKRLSEKAANSPEDSQLRVSSLLVSIYGSKIQHAVMGGWLTVNHLM